MRVWLITGAVLLSTLTGCDRVAGGTAPNCFSVVPSTSTQPFSSILVDSCAGKTWLLVKTRLGDKPNAGFTYQWMAIERLDFINPVLVN